MDYDVRFSVRDGCQFALVGISPGNTVLPEKLTGPQLGKKFPAFYGTRSFTTAVTTARNLSLS